jgi:sporulation-control protein
MVKMGFFKNVLASIGIGGTKIDTILHDNAVQIGGSLKGEVQIFGGTVAQQIKEFFIVLNTKAEKEADDNTYYVTMKVHAHHIPQAFEIQPGEKKVVPFELQIPYHSPISFGKVKLWIQTEAEIISAVDAHDQDMIKILPHPAQQVVLDAIAKLGFQLRNSDNEYSAYAPYHYEQEFEYYPSPEFRSYLDELEIAFQLSANELVVKMTIDRKARGLMGMLREAAGTDDKRIRITFNNDQLIRGGAEYAAREIRDVIHRYKK